MRQVRPLPVRYGVAALAVIAATLARALIYHWGGREIRLVPFQLAVVGAASYGGLGPGLLATGLCFIGAAWFLEPVGSMRIDGVQNIVHIAAFTAVNLLIVWVCQVLRTAGRRPHKRTAPSAEPRPPTISRSGAITHEPALSPSGGWLVGLLAPIILLSSFGVWGTLTATGARYFDEETALIPLVSLAAAPLILIVGLALWPLAPEEPAKDGQSAGA